MQRLHQLTCSIRQITLVGLWTAVTYGAAALSAETAPDNTAPDNTVTDGNATTDDSARSSHWAFLSPAKPALPSVRETSWCHSHIDRFILAEIERQQITVSPQTDRHTLIRRLTFDLIGLPPRISVVHQFLADSSPDAKSKLVDRLLASPHYGERWGRHWLDVVRYADSNGLDENVAYGNAWRYRDYVIRAWNSDKAYNTFLTEQLAGDLLPANENIDELHERLIATGFLSLGPKVLAEADSKKMQMDIVDEQIDTLGRALLGMTLGCARCHDHKFDPFSTQDYYGLAGIFSSTQTMDNFAIIAKWHENTIATPEQQQRADQHAALIDKVKKQISEVTDQAKEVVQSEATADTKLPDDLEPLFTDETKTKLKQLRDELEKLEASTPILPSAMGVNDGEIIDEAVRLRGDPLQQGEIVPRKLPDIFVNAHQPTFASQGSGRLELASWLVSQEHPLTARVMVNRLWRWHFGRGLVGTPDNFGRLGERPVNGNLLDWLARQFPADNWSIKRIQRRLVLSSTYCLSSRPMPKSVVVDPNNSLHWRTNVRRLEAEPLRDAILAVSNQLDTNMGGSLLHVKNREFLFNHTSKDGTKYDSHRRSVYLPVVRNHLFDVFSLFDYSDASVPNGDRPTSTIAPQALFMMNSDLLLAACTSLAIETLTDEISPDRQRIQQLYEQILRRPATEDEIHQAEQFLQQFTQIAETDADDRNQVRTDCWSAFCHILLASNEFVYLR